MTAEATDELPAALILRTDRSTSGAEPVVFGLSARERLRRSLLKAGVSRIDEMAPHEAPPSAPPGRSIVLRDDYFYDERLIAGLLQAGDCVLTVPDDARLAAHPPAHPQAERDERAHSGIAASADALLLTIAVGELRGLPEGQDAPSPDSRLPRVGVLDVAPGYNAALRRYDPAFVHPARAGSVREIEQQIFGASYKGLTDLVTKWVFPAPALLAVRILSRRGVMPNSVTAWSYVLAIAATWLFAEGWFAAGLLAGWIMTFLDTVDGKLARCTITSSRFGDVFDHGLDLIHPPIWWAAWAIGLSGGLEANALAAWVVVGGYAVGRALEGVFLAAFGMELFLWRRFDGFFRTIIARRNPNLILLSIGVAAGSPAGGYAAVAVWTAACLMIAATRIGQAFVLRARGGAIQPLLEDDRAAPA